MHEKRNLADDIFLVGSVFIGPFILLSILLSAGGPFFDRLEPILAPVGIPPLLIMMLGVFSSSFSLVVIYEFIALLGIRSFEVRYLLLPILLFIQMMIVDKWPAIGIIIVVGWTILFIIVLIVYTIQRRMENKEIQSRNGRMINTVRNPEKMQIGIFIMQQIVRTAHAVFARRRGGYFSCDFLNTL